MCILVNLSEILVSRQHNNDIVISMMYMIYNNAAYFLVIDNSFEIYSKDNPVTYIVKCVICIAIYFDLKPDTTWYREHWDTLKYRGILIWYAEEILYMSYSITSLYLYTSRVYSLKIGHSYSGLRDEQIRNQYHPEEILNTGPGWENGALLAWYTPYYCIWE